MSESRRARGHKKGGGGKTGKSRAKRQSKSGTRRMRLQISEEKCSVCGQLNPDLSFTQNGQIKRYHLKCR